MNGLTEDLLNGVSRDIEREWESKGGAHNIEYYVNVVRKSGLTDNDLSNFLMERKAVAPVSVVTVFNAVLHPEL